jgi:hypothetical protein
MHLIRLTNYKADKEVEYKMNGKNYFKSFLVAWLVVVLFTAPITYAARYENLTVGKLTVEKSLSVQGLLQAAANTTGNVYYVDSGAPGINAIGRGKDKTKPFATVDYAIGRCTANNGDFVIVMPGHAESYTAADGFDVDVAGVTVIGLGDGTDSPTFTFADTDATIAVGAANVTISNVRFVAGISAVVIGIAVEAAGDNFTLSNCTFPEPTTSTFEFLDAIDLAAGADSVTIVNNTYYNMDATGANHFLEAGNGVNNDLQVLNNLIMGEFAVSAIWSDTADLEVTIRGNDITNATNGQHAVEFTAAATGLIENCILRTDSNSTDLDPGSLTIGANVYWDDDSTADTMASQTSVAPGGSGSIGNINDTTTDSLHGKIGTDTEMSDSSLYDFIATIDAFHDVGTADAVTNVVMSDVVGNKADAAAAGAVSSTESLVAYAKQNVTEGIATTSAIGVIDGFHDVPGADVATNSQLRDVVGNKTDAAAAGAVSAVESLMAYAKQNVGETIKIDSGSMVAGPTAGSIGSFLGGTTALGTSLGNTESIVDVLYATNGIVTYPASQLPANGVSIAEVLREAYDQQEKSVSGSTAVMTNGDTIFTIANGPIEIIELVSVCITLNDATASTLQYSADPTVGAATTFSGASASLANAAAGSGVVLNMTALATAPDIIDPLVGLSAVHTRGIIVNEGIITIVIGVGTTTGTWKHYLRYRPLARGVTVTGT